jgi:glycosyltransferase involved in cell wall biosynthesis
MEHAHQTDLAKSACSGDWLFYLQSDEVIHEKFLPAIKARCEALIDDREVEGLLFRYRHFYGDYKHIQDAHCWYRKEIRIIRNDPDIHSWQSAQSFRRIPDFDGESYRMQEGTYKLKVAEVDAEVYHYGWVRPPQIMTKKIKALRLNHHGKKVVDMQAEEGHYDSEFDYGNLEKLEKFNGTHPKVMEDWIMKFNWQNKLRYKGPIVTANNVVNKHDKPKYRFLSWIEKNLLFGNRLGEFNNFVRVKK